MVGLGGMGAAFGTGASSGRGGSPGFRFTIYATLSIVIMFLDKRGEGLHHLAFTVDDLTARIAELKQSGLRMIDEIPRPGAHHMQIAFIHPKSTFGVLTELCQPAHAPATTSHA
jgi:catechol 2,3-dioxygenase-like lactoylglutathione lyase family enzyme